MKKLAHWLGGSKNAGVPGIGISKKTERRSSLDKDSGN
jgi:hypothetical protein